MGGEDVGWTVKTQALGYAPIDYNAPGDGCLSRNTQMRKIKQRLVEKILYTYASAVHHLMGALFQC